MSYQLRIAGLGVRATKPDFSILCDQAVDLAGRGYTAIITESSAVHRGVEITCRGDEFHVTTFDNSNHSASLQPGWMGTALHRIQGNITRRTTT